MDHPWRSLGLRSMACAALTGPIWYFAGPAIALPTVVAWGVWLAPPLMGVSSDLVRRLKAAAYRDVDGHYYAHAGFPIEVLETDDARWLRIAQVQRVLGNSTREDVFARRFDATHLMQGRRKRWFVRDEALLDYLAHSPVAIDASRNRLRLFVQREVIDPHRRQYRLPAYKTAATPGSDATDSASPQ